MSIIDEHYEHSSVEKLKRQPHYISLSTPLNLFFLIFHFISVKQLCERGKRAGLFSCWFFWDSEVFGRSTNLTLYKLLSSRGIIFFSCVLHFHVSLCNFLKFHGVFDKLQRPCMLYVVWWLVYAMYGSCWWWNWEAKHVIGWNFMQL